jgi:Fur family ferric uptake transcriptional regulator
VGADPSELLRRRGLRVTAQRLAVLRAVSEQPHASADAVLQAVRGEIGSISVQGVYDALAALTENGLLRRIQPAGSPARYEARVDDNHHHFVCRVCERMVDIDGAAGGAPAPTAVEAFGYEVEEAEVIYWGRCPDCLEKRGAR